MGTPVYGVLAHGHAWQRKESKPRENIQRALWDINTGAAHPVDLPDLICVANLGCWNLAVITDSRIKSDAAGQLVDSDALVQTMYLSWHENSGQPPPNPVAAAVTTLLGRLGCEDVNIRPLADYFRFADLIGQAQGQMRAWDASDVYTPEIAAAVEAGAIVQGGIQPWNEWSWLLW
jgi:hypothetical protein